VQHFRQLWRTRVFAMVFSDRYFFICTVFPHHLTSIWVAIFLIFLVPNWMPCFLCYSRREMSLKESICSIFCLYCFKTAVLSIIWNMLSVLCGKKAPIKMKCRRCRYAYPFEDITWSTRRNCCLFITDAQATSISRRFHLQWMYHELSLFCIGNVITILKTKWQSNCCLTFFITKMKERSIVVRVLGFPIEVNNLRMIFNSVFKQCILSSPHQV